MIDSTLEFLKVAARVMSPLSFSIMENTQKAAEKTNTIHNIDDLREEAIRQEITTHMSELQAKVEQELAIARRIVTAHEVEIEEFYDTSGEGDVGLNISEGKFGLGASGSGRKVAKRVYRFKGFHGGLESSVEKSVQDEDSLSVTNNSNEN